VASQIQGSSLAKPAILSTHWIKIYMGLFTLLHTGLHIVDCAFLAHY